MFFLRIMIQVSAQDDIAISSCGTAISNVSWFHDYFAWQHITPVGKTARHLLSPEVSRTTDLEAQTAHFSYPTSSMGLVYDHRYEKP